MPAGGGLRMVVALDVHRLLRSRKVGRLRWVDADRNDVEVLAGAEFDHLEGADEAIQLLGTEHRAGVVNDRENNRPFAEIIAKLDGCPGFIAKDCVQGCLLVETLMDENLVQNRRRMIDRDLAHLFIAVRGNLRERCH